MPFQRNCMARTLCRPTGLPKLLVSPRRAGINRLPCIINPSLSRITSITTSSSSGPSASSPPLSGALSYLPRSIRPYLFLTRLDKPTGTFLLFLPCTWSIAMAAHALALPPSIPLAYTALFGVGAFVMRGAGCTINDMWDHRLDRLVERTRTRPLASGALNMTQATAFLGLQLAAGLAVLTQLNWYSIGMGASSLALVAVYPYMKRITYWPQFVLGLTFNWGALLGYCALHAPPDWSVVLPLYASGVCWTLVYDTIYAHQDKTDDIPAHIRSTALLFGARTPEILSGFSVAFLSLLVLSGYLNSHGVPFYVISVGGAGLGLAKILRDVDWDDRSSCWTGFRRNIGVGSIVAAGIWADYLWEGRWRLGEKIDGDELKLAFSAE